MRLSFRFVIDAGHRLDQAWSAGRFQSFGSGMFQETITQSYGWGHPGGRSPRGLCKSDFYYGKERRLDSGLRGQEFGIRFARADM